MNERSVLVVPGYLDSGEGHWQTRWEALHADFRRVRMPDWLHPDRDAWCRALDAAVAAANGRVLLAAHSLGCLTIACWALRDGAREQVAKVDGALLVAVPDPDGPQFPATATGYGAVPLDTLPFASIVVASSDDPYGGVAFAQRCANAWGSGWENLGARGHINADSGLGDWPQGLARLASLGRGGRSGTGG
ncbi:RBBP9/YdeN family alpha/beta hydrolase [Paraburkholderia caballeronis]|uniref:RBBP9/YdeN family alpha/beta hydrolase n=1 Tax=Paraburkholderia caballeronis TaxID=416943 RepID=UPI0010664847|nr:alpha/beta hydrolase [Paraburkholderia caballeronis]TDV04626.1 hypothetical protein C7408_13233 [Paraburkholderia caballeronis]TDV07769.1 hypothetical protein C7406_13434 [Paraburkholderia caballeronis]TDV18160.1 hypothetical protein C7404_13234 [Paraburkholderia caballeronis]